MKPLVIVLVVVGLLFLGGAYIYWTTPANMLPHFLPGYSAGLTKIHRTHALASAALGLGSFILAWFQTGKNHLNRSRKIPPKRTQ